MKIHCILAAITVIRISGVLAACQGVAIAQHNLGVMYLFGKGVAKNDAIADTWLKMAATSGLGSERNLIAARMKCQDILKVQKMSTACLNSDDMN